MPSLTHTHKHSHSRTQTHTHTKSFHDVKTRLLCIRTVLLYEVWIRRRGTLPIPSSLSLIHPSIPPSIHPSFYDLLSSCLATLFFTAPVNQAERNTVQYIISCVIKKSLKSVCVCVSLTPAATETHGQT